MNVVKDYNNNTSGIDRADQMISYYDSLRRTSHWYKEVGHIFEIRIHNAYSLNVMYGTDDLITLLK